jgi:hypothetical protein
MIKAKNPSVMKSHQIMIFPSANTHQGDFPARLEQRLGQNVAAVNATASDCKPQRDQRDT